MLNIQRRGCRLVYLAVIGLKTVPVCSSFDFSMLSSSFGDGELFCGDDSLSFFSVFTREGVEFRTG